MKPHGITAGLVAYNAECTVDRAIRSIISQTEKIDELVIIDDCSLDGTLEKIRSLTRGLLIPVKVIQNDVNRGIGFNRLLVLENANFNIIVFFDDDDWSHRSRISVHLREIREVKRVNKFDHHIMSLVGRKKGLMVSIPHHHRWREVLNGCPDDSMRLFDWPNSFDEILLGNRVSGWGHGHTASCGMALYIGTDSQCKYQFFREQFRRSEDTDCAIRFSSLGGVIVGEKSILVDQAKSAGTEKNIASEYRNVLKLIQSCDPLIKQCRESRSSIKFRLRLRFLRTVVDLPVLFLYVLNQALFGRKLTHLCKLITKKLPLD